MNAVDNLLSLLNTWPAWKRIVSAPAEIDALRKRIELLEQTLATRAPGQDQCPKCSSLTFRLDRTVPEPEPWGAMGAMQDEWRCASCGYTRIDRGNDRRR